MEFRGKVDSPQWKTVWDWAFGLGSLLPAILLGVAFGNILRGIPLNEQGTFTGSFFGLLNPYALLVGILSLCLFTMHGAIFLTMKTEGDFRERMASAASTFWAGTVGLYTLATLASLFVSPFLFEGMLGNPLFWVLFLLLLASLIAIPVLLKGKRFFATFLASSTVVASVIGLSALSLFPRLVPSLTNLDHSLTIRNASSTPATLTVMLVIALIGMPIVIGYTIFIYRVFKGKVELTEASY